MKTKIFHKMIISYVMSVILCFFAISFISQKMNYKKILHNTQDVMYREASYIADSFAYDYYSGVLTSTAIANQLKTVAYYLDCQVLLLSMDGKVIVDTEATGITEIPEFDPADYGASRYKVNNFYGIYNSDHVSVYYPAVTEFTIRGYIILTKSVSSIRHTADSVYNFNYITMLICFLLSGFIFILFYCYITKPLNKITNKVAKYAKGDFSEKIGFKRNDEIGRLSDSLDYMASEINSLNEYQKKFIANVSHDFRSPLTSIKGYLEAMLDGTIPVEMQEKYLNIVISETERLTKLTNNLLTMNNVTDKGMVLDISSFDIIAIIKQTIETFQGVCEKKKIKFKLLFSDKSLNVVADQAKIQQVIYNLLDNAIKFSNSESSIIISVSTKNDKVLISVKDFGIGIPKDSISKIWERFYKSDLSRGRDKKGTGLGLSIVKEIIKAHNEYIDVISTEGVGTEFIFALPKEKENHEPFLGLN